MTQAHQSSATPDAPGEQRGWTATADTFAARLALVRHRMGWNFKEASLACGVPEATWRTWEIDGTTPRDIRAIAKQIAEHAGCDYLWLLLGAQHETRDAA